MAASCRARFILVAFAAIAVFPGAAASQTTDHFKCYNVKGSETFKSARADLQPVQPQFPFAPGCEIKRKPKQVCVPVEKRVQELEGGSTINFTSQILQSSQLCYKLKCTKVQIPPLAVADQFGARVIEKFKTSRLCTPAMAE